MTNYREIRSNEDIYRARAEKRRQDAEEPFEKKLVTVVRLQQRAAAMAESAGRTCSAPWHSEDKKRMKAYGSPDWDKQWRQN